MPRPDSAGRAARLTLPGGQRRGDAHRRQIFRAWVRWNSPSGRNISTTAITM